MHLKHLRPYQLHELVASGHPLLVPAGCIETHGPHMAIGHDTLIVEEICERVAARVDRYAEVGEPDPDRGGVRRGEREGEHVPRREVAVQQPGGDDGGGGVADLRHAPALRCSPPKVLLPAFCRHLAGNQQNIMISYSLVTY